MKRAKPVNLLVVASLWIVVSVYGAEKKSVDDYAAIYNVRDWSTEIRDNRAVEKVHRRITIKNRRGDQYANLAFFDTRFARLGDVSIIVSDASGKVLNSYQKKDLKKECGYGPSYVLYADNCTYYMNVAVANFPYVIDYTYSREYSSLYVLDGVSLIGDLPVEQATATLTFPSTETVHVRQYAIDVQKTEEVNDGRTTWIWKASNLMPPKKDSLSKLDVDRAGSVAITADKIALGKYRLSGMNWQNVGRWYNELALDQYDRTDWPKDGVYRSDSLIEIMRETYDNLRHATRYVAVTIGVGGWQPESAKRTRETSFGDCKGLSTLLISELRSKRVHAQPVLVLTKGEGIVDTSFPNFEFNHLITAVPAGADTFWLDPTCSNCPFGDLPSPDEDIDVLLIDENGGHIVHTPRSTCYDNLVTRVARVRVLPALNLVIEGAMTYTGNYAQGNWTGWSSMKLDELKLFVNKSLGDMRTPITVKEADLYDGVNNDSCTTIRFRATSRQPLKLLNSTLYLAASPFYQAEKNTAKDVEDLNRPLYLGYPAGVIDSVTIVWDNALNVDSLAPPDMTELVDSNGAASCRSYSLGDSLVVVFAEAQTTYEVPQAQFESYLKYEADLARMQKQRVKLYIGTR